VYARLRGARARADLARREQLGRLDRLAAGASAPISGVIHKAWVKVDEKGAEAAAATAVVAGITAVQIPHPFKVDRSFLFFIHDNKGNVLFSGRIVDPSQS
jgi:serpin B